MTHSIPDGVFARQRLASDLFSWKAALAIFPVGDIKDMMFMLSGFSISGNPHVGQLPLALGVPQEHFGGSSGDRL